MGCCREGEREKKSKREQETYRDDGRGVHARGELGRELALDAVAQPRVDDLGVRPDAVVRGACVQPT